MNLILRVRYNYVGVKLFAFIFVAVYCLLPKVVCSQVPFSINYTTENGLLSNTIYESIQDKNGFIWFATELGISRFDGKQFRNFTKNDGLTDNVCIAMICDTSNRLWIGLLNGDYCFIENGKVYNKNNQTTLNQLCKLKTYNHLSINEKNELVFRGESCYYNINPKNLSITKKALDAEGSRCFLGYERYIVSQTPNSFYIIGDKQDTIPNNTFTGNITGRRYADLFEGYLTLLSDGKLIQVYKNQCVQNNYFDLKNIEILGFFRHHNSFLILTNKGIYTLPVTQINAIPQIWMDINSAHNLYIDKDKCIWIVTFENGLIKVPDTKMKLLAIKEGASSTVSLENSQLFIGTTNGLLKSFRKVGNAYQEQTSSNLFSFVRQVEIHHGKLFALTKFLLFEIDLKSKVIVSHTFKSTSLKSILVANDSSVYVSTNWCVFKIKNRKITFAYESNAVNRIYGLFKNMNNELCLGTEKGLLFVHKDGKRDTLIQDKINMITTIDEHSFACATESKGILLIKDNHIISTFRPNGIKDFICNSIQYDSIDHFLFAGTSEGLYYFNIERSKLECLKQVGEEFGLYKKQIQDISYNQKELFLATQSGILIMEKNVHANSKIMYSLYLNSFKANGNPILSENALHLDKGVNHIEVEAQVVSYGSHHHIQYAFQLTGANSDTLYSNDGKITFTNLIPGSYHLYIKAFSISNDQLAIHKRIDFSIAPYWWQTLTFKLSILILSILTFIIIFNLLRKRANNKMKNQNLLLDMEVRALRSQMNPHFIFNSLNSAQEYIFNDKPQEANKYLSVFSKMVRMSLNFSSKNAISILDEINYLNLFLQLEKMKYEAKFDYSIHVDDAIVCDYTYIPSMILQPIVENAVVHGVLNKSGNGFIKISFQQNNEFIICKVEDDGIGRNESKKRKNMQGNSISTNNIIHRIHLLNTNHRKNKIEYKFTDKYDANHISTGTLFEVKFPLNFINK